MSLEAMAWVIRHSPFKATTFVVHLIIADQVSEDHGNLFWSSQANVAAKARVGRQTANRALATLCHGGFLTCVEDRHGDGRPNLYRFEYLDVPVAYDYGRVSQKATSLEPPIMSPTTTPGVAYCDNREASQAEPNLSLVPPAVDDPPHPAFVDTWAIYPRKTNKRGAYKAWRATLRRVGNNSPPSYAEIARRIRAAVVNYRDAVDGKESEFVMYGATFFGPNDRWLDYEHADTSTGTRSPDWMRGT